MGAVYKAQDRELDRVVAIKVIRPELASNPAIIQRFKQGLTLARQVTHRNVIRIYDLGEAEGMKLITMEFVEGEDLHSLLAEQGKFSPAEAMQQARSRRRAGPPPLRAKREGGSVRLHTQRVPKLRRLLAVSL